MKFARLFICIFCIFFTMKVSFGETLRIGESMRWRTLEPVTAKFPVEKRISSLLYQRMFLYDKTVFNKKHKGLKPLLVNVDKADTINGQYILGFKRPEIGPEDLRYTVEIMNNPKTKYHQPLFCPYWDLSRPWFVYNDQFADKAGIIMKKGVALTKANFHLVKKHMLGENYIDKSFDKNFGNENDNTKDIINNASTGPYQIEVIQKSFLALTSRKTKGNIDKIRIDIASESALRDRLRQPKRSEASVDMIPEMNIKEVATYEESHFEGRYKVSTPASNNFCMIGFNYHATSPESVRNLFHKKIFRYFLGLTINVSVLFESTLKMSQGHGLLLCGPLFRRPGIEQIDNYIEFCSATRFIRGSGYDSKYISKYLSSLEKQIRGIQYVKSNSDGALLFHRRPLKLVLIYPMFDMMSADMNNVAISIKDRLENKGISLQTSGISTREKWDIRINEKDFDLILFNGFYDYSYDITGYFEKDNPLNVCGLPNDASKKVQDLIKKYRFSGSGTYEDKTKILMKLNALLSNETIGIFLWNLKYKTVYRSALTFGPGQSGINDLDLFQGIDNWMISE